MKITEQIILKLLEHKHSKDVYIPKCKTGATHINPHLLIIEVIEYGYFDIDGNPKY